MPIMSSLKSMNITSSLADENWFNDIQYGNKGAALFIIAYIGFYGLGIICLFIQQLKETQRQRHELPASFFKTFWDVPNKDKIYQELADVDRLKRIFRVYFADHETCMTIGNDALQAIIDQHAYACAKRYQQKLRLLRVSHADYYLDTIQRLAYDNRQSISVTQTSLRNSTMDFSDRENNQDQILSISVV